MDVKATHKEIPSEWLKDSRLMALASTHQEWLVTPMASNIKKLLDTMIDKAGMSACAKSVTSEVSAETVRVCVAQMFAYNKVKETLYDTEKFVKNFA